MSTVREKMNEIARDVNLEKVTIEDIENALERFGRVVLEYGGSKLTHISHTHSGWDEMLDDDTNF